MNEKVRFYRISYVAFWCKIFCSPWQPRTLKLSVCQLRNLIRTTFGTSENQYRQSTNKMQKTISTIKWQPKKQCENSPAHSCLLKTSNVQGNFFQFLQVAIQLMIFIGCCNSNYLIVNQYFRLPRRPQTTQLGCALHRHKLF